MAGLRGAVSKDRLRLVSMLAPLAALAALYPLRLLLLRIWPAPAVDALVGALMVIGVLSFSWYIFHIIDRQETQLAQQHEALALLKERERIVLALQDGAIQMLYAVNLDLEMALDELGADRHPAGTRIDRSIDRLGTVMEDIRRCILGKGLLEAEGESAAGADR